MAKLKRNHGGGNKKSGFSMIRVVFFLLFLMGMMYYLYQTMINGDTSSSPSVVIASDSGPNSETTSDFLPCYEKGEIVHHKYYSLGYNESAEQAYWVAYQLTKESLLLPNVKRAKRFNPDYDVSTGSAFHRDYTGSGYSRGHLAPAGDMAFSEEAMKESFLMSNMSPQLRGFNGGIWKELEEQVRDWAFHNNSLYVITGPLLNRGYVKVVGKNHVKVPKYFYKIILDNTGRRKKAIAFVMPNEVSTQRLELYVTTIDAIEEETGIDFFCDLLSDNVEERLESQSDVSLWKMSEKRFQARVKHWNNY